MSPVRWRDRWTAAVVAAVVAGVAEGLVRLVTRGVPRLHAAHKLSPDVLWAAPLVNLAFFLALAAGLHLVLPRTPGPVRRRDARITRASLVALGAIGVGLATAVLHPASVVVLGLGIGVVAARRVAPDAVPRPGRRLTVAAALAGGAVAVAALWGPIGERARAGGLAPAPDGAPNVLVLMLDTVRRDELTGDAGARNAPRLTTLARRGVRFEDAWSTTSWSLPAQASVLTGLHPADHGADWPDFRLADSVPTLAERFRSRGYATGAFSGNSSWITPEYVGRGFLRFRVYVLEDLLRRTALGKWADGLARALSFYAAGRGKKAPAIHRQLWDFVDDYEGRPFFAYLCYMDANHAIYARKFNRYFRRLAPNPEVHDAYVEGIRVLDSHIGEMLDELERRGLRRSTVIVVLSDHGESFGPEVGQDHLPLGHGTHLYPEQTRVPLFVVAPGLAPGTVREPVGIADVPATLASLLGWENDTPGAPLPPPRGAEVPPDTSGAAETAARDAWMTLGYLDRDLRAIAVPGWEYIVDGDAEGSGELVRLDGADTPPPAGLARHLARRLEARVGPRRRE